MARPPRRAGERLLGIVAAQIGNVFACRTDRESVFRVGLLGQPHASATTR